MVVSIGTSCSSRLNASRPIPIPSGVGGVVGVPLFIDLVSMDWVPDIMAVVFSSSGRSERAVVGYHVLGGFS